MIDAADCERAMRRGVEFLRRSQLRSGEFKTLVARDTGLTLDARHDPSPFATAHIVSSLATCRLGECAPIIEHAAGFLVRQRLPGGVWKFWSRCNKGSATIPADVDDTCVVSTALWDAGAKAASDRRITLANRDAEGRFLTWIQPRVCRANDPGLWLNPALYSRAVRGRKRFFVVGEARSTDVDVVVNANAVCWHHDAHEATQAARAWVVRVVESGTEVESDRYYQSRYALYYAVSRGLRRGIAEFAPAASVMTGRIHDDVHPDGRIGCGVQDTALAAIVLAAVHAQGADLDRAIDFMLTRQRPDGSWPGEAYYYGGWSRDLCWGASELTTAFCLEAAAQFLAARGTS